MSVSGGLEGAVTSQTHSPSLQLLLSQLSLASEPRVWPAAACDVARCLPDTACPLLHTRHMKVKYNQRHLTQAQITKCWASHDDITSYKHSSTVHSLTDLNFALNILLIKSKSMPCLVFHCYQCSLRGSQHEKYWTTKGNVVDGIKELREQDGVDLTIKIEWPTKHFNNK